MAKVRMGNDEKRTRGVSAWLMLPLALLLAGAVSSAQTDGGLANGLSANATGRGGTMVAEHDDPLEAIEGNPAGLAGMRTRELNLSAVGVVATGSFENSVDPKGKLNGVAGALPYAGASLPLGKWTAGFGLTPEMLMRVNWRYIDPAGTAGASYGLESDKSEIVALRGSLAIARQVGSKWGFGGTFGLVYNENTLVAPYIFQEQAELAGLKVLLNLRTKGFGWTGSAGAQFRPSARLTLGAAWKSATYVQSHGDASGTASAQFVALGIAADPTFHYLAEVDNKLPEAASLGGAWQVNRRMRFSFESDWTGWASAFRTLPVKLKDGTNATINCVAGSSSIVDGVPLHWRDQLGIRAGVEMTIRHGWTARGGYAWFSDPVPSATLTPLTAAIFQNTVSAGVSRSGERTEWGVAYQAQLPANQSVGKSDLLAGEYDNTHVRVMAQGVTVSARIHF